LGIASIIGPHTFNFAEVTQTMLDAEAILQVKSIPELEAAVVEWLASSATPRRIGRAARQVLDDNKGAVACLLDQVSSLVPRS